MRWDERGSATALGQPVFILGMSTIIGDDSLRRALSAIAPAPDDERTGEQRAAQQAQLARRVHKLRRPCGKSRGDCSISLG